MGTTSLCYVDNGLQNKNEDIDTSELYIKVCHEHKYISEDGLKYRSANGYYVMKNDL